MPKIIISFTSYPRRIKTVTQVLDSIKSQTILPDKIILYLSSEQFVNHNKLPDFSDYYSYGFELCWCKDDLKSHKKYYYAMQQYPDDIIITIDDDTCYKETMIEELLFYYKKFPSAVIARRGHLITCQADGTIASYNRWYGECGLYIGIPRMDLFATGCAGILYPPHIFDKEVFNKEVFMREAPYADDMWLKIMEIRNNVPVVLTNILSEDITLTCAEDGLFNNHNSNGGNDIQLSNLLRIYDKMCEEKNFFANRIFSENVHIDSVENRRNDMQQMIFEFLKLINDEKEILIYGAGTVAKRLYEEFDKNGNKKKIKSFIVYSKENNKSDINGIPVREYKHFVDAPEKIIIGLWENKQDEAYSELVKNGIDKKRIIRVPLFVNKALEFLHKENKKWEGSEKYWNDRYKNKGNSGTGSYNRLAEFKAEVINEFIRENKIISVIEWGCGDGNQLSLGNYPEYIGYDISKEAVEICSKKYKNDRTKEFIWCGNKNFVNKVKADLTLSLDVIYHLVEDKVYQIYMDRLFSSSTKYVCIYSCNYDDNFAEHVRCRRFTDYVKNNFKEWKLIKYLPNKYPYKEKEPDNTSWSDFFFYKKQF